MSSIVGHFPRGSEWRIWDLHIHTPASFYWKGTRLIQAADDAARNALLDSMIEALNEAEPDVFAIMDYWTFDGWFALKQRLAQADAPKLNKTVFPGIELRLAAPMQGRLNAHVIFSDKIPDQDLIDFKGRLILELIKKPLSDAALREFARNAGPDKLKKHGFKKEEVTADYDVALAAGCHIAELSRESYTAAINAVPDGFAVGFMPFDTNDGLAEVHWDQHYAYALDLFQFSPIFETRNLALRAALVGLKTDDNNKWYENFRTALKQVSRLAICGSDAHCFKGTPGDNDKRGYGDFPSQTKTWIKADPTWLGLLQAIKEPEKRSYIGASPPKLDFVKANPSFYIDCIRISKIEGSSAPHDWLHGCDVQLNADLVAVIGNKGSGKSAFADIIALLGNSQQREYFQFLKKDRFRGRSGEPARQFRGELIWRAGPTGGMVLSEDPSENKVELVRYIPQHRFEALCNDHVSGRGATFEKELRSVIFSHVEPSVSLGALDFEQLIEQQEASFRANLIELRKTLHALNDEIFVIEDQLNPNARVVIEEQLKLKQAELEQHLSMKPEEVSEPTGELTPGQTLAKTRLGEITTAVTALDERAHQAAETAQDISRRRRSIRNIRDRADILQRQFAEFTNAITTDLGIVGLSIEDVASLTLHQAPLEKLAAALTKTETDTTAQSDKDAVDKTALEAERKTLGATLNEPQQKYQQYLLDLQAWNTKRVDIEGTTSSPESVNGMQARLSQIANLPNVLAAKKLVRKGLTMQIYGVLEEQRAARAALFSPLQQVIDSNTLIKTDYKLQFEAKLYGSADTVASRLFDVIKRSVGELRGEEESDLAVRSRFDKYDFTNAEDATSFADEIVSMIEGANTKGGAFGIRQHLKKDKSPSDVYDYVCGVSYLEPKYTLLFQDTQIEQLSPGQRGALLLIFYLLVDKRRNPIILDQPEENLDNETVVSLLVPVINEAKKLRQIIMVTHNPNLAVVCDAEQIVYASFERKDGPKITYYSGSIEHQKTNRHVIDVLEGTKPAFTNRGTKYH